MSGSTNDARVLRQSSLYRLATTSTLFDVSQGSEGFSPYLLGDYDYPLSPCVIVPHRGQNNTILEALCNRKLQRSRGVIENAFGIFKEAWREFLIRIELNIVSISNVNTTCAILHNILR